MELRRRLSKGLLVSTNYTYGIRKGLVNNSIRLDRMEVDNTGVPHEFNADFTYEVPVGRGRRFGTDMSIPARAFSEGLCDLVRMPTGDGEYGTRHAQGNAAASHSALPPHA